MSRLWKQILIGLVLVTASSCHKIESPNSSPLGPQPEKRVDINGLELSAQKNNIDWTKEIVYFVVVDRFFDGNPDNNRAGNPNSHNLYIEGESDFEALKTYQGGDLKGLTEKLDYIKNLGVTSIWVSPIYENGDTDIFGFWPYHGYHATDFYDVEDHFGSMNDMKVFVQKAHELGLKVILDIVNNHAGPDHPFVSDPTNWRDRGYHNWFHPRSFTDYTSIKDTEWNNLDLVEQKEFAGLPDFKQENPHVYDYLLDISKYWISELGVDGFRLDTVRHISRDYWERYNKDIKEFAGKDFFLIGEVFRYDPKDIKMYRRIGFDSLFNFPLLGQIRNVFALGDHLTKLTSDLQKTYEAFGEDEIPGLFIDNHDMKRFASQAKNFPKLRTQMALTFINAINGIPFVYYGTEIAMEGGDPDYLNRKMMDFEVAEQELDPTGSVSYMSRLLNARTSHPALYSGSMVELYKDEYTYVFAKVVDEEIAVVAMNNSQFPRTITVPLRPNMFSLDLNQSEISGNALATLTGVLRQTSAKVTSPQSILVSLPALSADIYFLDNKNNFTVGDERTFEPLAKAGKFIEFNVDFVYPNNSDTIKSIHLVGDINPGDPTLLPMKLNADKNQWELSLKVPPGYYTYKFLINEKTEVFDTEQDYSILDQSNIVIVSNSGVAAPTIFDFKIENKTDFESVKVLGDFNNWDKSTAIPLSYNSDTNNWETSIFLPPGVYAYNYLINDKNQIKSDLEYYTSGTDENFLVVTEDGLVDPSQHRISYPHSININSVEIFGSFNKYDEANSLPMMLNEELGEWEIYVYLIPKPHVLRYIVNGEVQEFDSEVDAQNVLIITPQGNITPVSIEFVYDGAAADTESVAIVFDFSNWQDLIPLTYDANTNTWKTTLKLMPGASYNYKYVVNGTDWGLDANDPFIPDWPQPSHKVIVTKEGAMSPLEVTVSYPNIGSISSIHLVGDFNQWDESNLPMTLNKQTNRWERRLRLLPHEYRYKFLVNGSDYVINSEFNLAPGSSDSAANNWLVVTERGIATPQSIKFAYIPEDRNDIMKLQVIGDFIGWSQKQAPQLTFNRDTGAWEGTLDLLPGEYRYKFLANGAANPAEDWLTPSDSDGLENDGFGGFNGVVRVK